VEEETVENEEASKVLNMLAHALNESLASGGRSSERKAYQDMSRDIHQLQVRISSR
jgi:hypothetical protein